MQKICCDFSCEWETAKGLFLYTDCKRNLQTIHSKVGLFTMNKVASMCATALLLLPGEGEAAEKHPVSPESALVFDLMGEFRAFYKEMEPHVEKTKRIEMARVINSLIYAYWLGTKDSPDPQEKELMQRLGHDVRFFERGLESLKLSSDPLSKELGALRLNPGMEIHFGTFRLRDYLDAPALYQSHVVEFERALGRAEDDVRNP